MKKLLMVLGFCGAMVSSAAAGERWSADACGRLQEMKVDVYRVNKGHEQLAWMLLPILARQQTNCGVNTDAEADALTVTHKPRPRQSLHCYTTGVGKGSSMTNCD